jgi:hypothetical protein
MFSEKAGMQELAPIGFKEFGVPEFEKYLELRTGRSAKKTWFFALDAHKGSRRSRYLFWLGFGSLALKTALGPDSVTLHVSFADESNRFEIPDGSQDISLPSLCEIGYDASAEKFYWRNRNGQIDTGRIEEAAQPFFEQIAKRLV